MLIFMMTLGMVCLSIILFDRFLPVKCKCDVFHESDSYLYFCQIVNNTSDVSPFCTDNIGQLIDKL